MVEAEDIAEVVATWTGIPVSSLLQTEAERLLDMEEHLHQRIVGQDEAINAIADAIRRARSGLKDPRRPIGSFIFLGSSGVGKTELAKALAQFMFDDEDAMVRIDMSEYREQHTVSRLFGAPPGYVGYEEGGQLTEAVRRRPYQMVLFDEIEKAHADVWNALLQILEDGRLTDGQGRIVDFRNTVIIMTSNIGTEYAKQGGTLGFVRSSNGDDEARESKKKIEDGLRKTFRPEFLNRIDEIIIFHTLTLEHMVADRRPADERDPRAAGGTGHHRRADRCRPRVAGPRRATTLPLAPGRCGALCSATWRARSPSASCGANSRWEIRSWPTWATTMAWRSKNRSPARSKNPHQSKRPSK